jgi:broad specificity phosphatase PhoE
VTRLLLVRHAPTAATGRAFAADEPICDPGQVFGALHGRLPAGAEAVCSPKLRCRQTAEAAGLRPALDPRLAECDLGSWEGSAVEALAADPAWRWPLDPDAAPHGGESLTAFSGRVRGWLEEVAPSDRPLVAVTHAGVIRAAVVHAIGAPLASFWNIAVVPLAVVELHRHVDGWTVAL